MSGYIIRTDIDDIYEQGEAEGLRRIPGARTRTDNGIKISGIAVLAIYAT